MSTFSRSHRVIIGAAFVTLLAASGSARVQHAVEASLIRQSGPPAKAVTEGTGPSMMGGRAKDVKSTESEGSSGAGSLTHADSLAASTAATSPEPAHAILVEATPAVDSTVVGPDIALKLRFNARVDSSRSRLTLISPDAMALQLVIQPEPSPDTLASQAAGLKPGQYRLRWQVLAADGHITRGEVPFKVS